MLAHTRRRDPDATLKGGTSITATSMSVRLLFRSTLTNGNGAPASTRYHTAAKERTALRRTTFKARAEFEAA